MWWWRENFWFGIFRLYGWGIQLEFRMGLLPSGDWVWGGRNLCDFRVMRQRALDPTLSSRSLLASATGLRSGPIWAPCSAVCCGHRGLACSLGLVRVQWSSPADSAPPWLSLLEQSPERPHVLQPASSQVNIPQPLWQDYLFSDLPALNPAAFYLPCGICGNCFAWHTAVTGSETRESKLGLSSPVALSEHGHNHSWQAPGL